MTERYEEPLSDAIWALQAALKWLREHTAPEPITVLYSKHTKKVDIHLRWDDFEEIFDGCEVWGAEYVREQGRDCVKWTRLHSAVDGAWLSISAFQTIKTPPDDFPIKYTLRKPPEGPDPNEGCHPYDDLKPEVKGF